MKWGCTGISFLLTILNISDLQLKAEKYLEYAYIFVLIVWFGQFKLKEKGLLEDMMGLEKICELVFLDKKLGGFCWKLMELNQSNLKQI